MVFSQQILPSSQVVIEPRPSTDPVITLSMFVLLFIFVIVCVEAKSLQVIYRFFIYVLSLEIQLSRR
jgi:hypothetical protein